MRRARHLGAARPHREQGHAREALANEGEAAQDAAGGKGEVLELEAHLSRVQRHLPVVARLPEERGQVEDDDLQDEGHGAGRGDEGRRV